MPAQAGIQSKEDRDRDRKKGRSGLCLNSLSCLASVCPSSNASSIHRLQEKIDCEVPDFAAMLNAFIDCVAKMKPIVDPRASNRDIQFRNVVSMPRCEIGQAKGADASQGL